MGGGSNIYVRETIWQAEMADNSLAGLETNQTRTCAEKKCSLVSQVEMNLDRRGNCEFQVAQLSHPALSGCLMLVDSDHPLGMKEAEHAAQEICCEDAAKGNVVKSRDRSLGCSARRRDGRRNVRK